MKYYKLTSDGGLKLQAPIDGDGSAEHQEAATVLIFEAFLPFRKTTPDCSTEFSRIEITMIAEAEDGIETV